MAVGKKMCCFCGDPVEPLKNLKGEIVYQGGNNPAPVNNEPGAACCDVCNLIKVLPARMAQFGVVKS